jgi:hypothetical protein
MSIESFIVRIIPGNTKQEEYLKRTTFYYKITGLPLNTTVQDMVPILQHLAGKTCTFNDQGRNSTSKLAYIYTEEKNFKPKKQKTTFHKSTIYILPQYNNYTCTHCGSPNHRITDCKEEDFIQNGLYKIFKKRFIPRSTPTIIMDKNLNDEYKHVIQMNKSIKLQKSQLNNQPNNQRTRGRNNARNDTWEDSKPQNYRSNSKGERPNTNKNKQKQKEISNYNQVDNTSHTTHPEYNLKQNTSINQEVQEFMTRSNKMFEVMNNKIQDLEKSLEEQKNINEKLIKSINKTEEKHINLELTMEKMMAQIAQLNRKMNIIIDALKNNNNNNNSNEEPQIINDIESSHDSNNTINNYQQQLNNFRYSTTERQMDATNTELQYESVTSQDGMSQMDSNYNEHNEYDEELENKNNNNNQSIITGCNWLNLIRYYTN